MAAPELPPEILFRILASVPTGKPNEEGARTLSACALTCHSWLEEARRWLYHHIIISKWGQYSRLSRTLTQNPAFAALIHELHLWIDSEHGLSYTGHRYVPFNPHAVGLLVNLQDLAIQWKPSRSVPREFLPFVWTFAACRSLRTLRLLGLRFLHKNEFDRTLWSFPDVTAVQVSDCRWDTVFSGLFIDEDYGKGTGHFLRVEEKEPRYPGYDGPEEDEESDGGDEENVEEDEGNTEDDENDTEDDENNTEEEENVEGNGEDVEEDREEDTASSRWYPYRALDDLEICVWKGVQNTLLTFGPRVKKLSLQLKPEREKPNVSMAAIKRYVDLEHLALEFWGTDTDWVLAVLSNIRAENLKTLKLTHQCGQSSQESILEAWDGLHLDSVLAENGSLTDLRHLSLCFVWSGTEARDTAGNWPERVRSLFPQRLFEIEIVDVTQSSSS